jgi:hypothetical protein
VPHASIPTSHFATNSAARHWETVTPPCDLGSADHAAQTFEGAHNFQAIALRQYRQKLIFLPAPEKIGGTQAVLKRLAHYAQNRGDRCRPIAQLNFLEAVDLDIQNGKTARDVRQTSRGAHEGATA